MKLNKFAHEQGVYALTSYKAYPICDICEGSGVVTVLKKDESTVQAQCPYCEGRGVTYGKARTILWKLNIGSLPWKINGIHMTHWKGKEPEYGYFATYYYPNGGACSGTLSEDDCFLTLKEAIKEMGRRNASPVKDYEDED